MDDVFVDICVGRRYFTAGSGSVGAGLGRVGVDYYFDRVELITASYSCGIAPWWLFFFVVVMSARAILPNGGGT